MDNNKKTNLNPLTIILLIVCLILIIVVCILLINIKSSPKTEQHENPQISSPKMEQHENPQRPSSLAGVSRENPILLGVSAIMYDGMEMTVLSFDRDAWPKIREINQFNTPQAPNKRMLMIRIRIKNISAKKEPMRWGIFSEIGLIGSYNRVWYPSESESNCGSIPDYFGEVQLYRNGEKEGNVCFQIPKDETNLLLRYDENDNMSTRNYRYFVVEK